MEYRIIKNFKDNPIEIFDGIEPDHLSLTPEMWGLNKNYQKIDLLNSEDIIPIKQSSAEINLEATRVMDESVAKIFEQIETLRREMKSFRV